MGVEHEMLCKFFPEECCPEEQVCVAGRMRRHGPTEPGTLARRPCYCFKKIFDLRSSPAYLHVFTFFRYESSYFPVRALGFGLPRRF